MVELRLEGCRCRPLGGYLKALGVLRTVARQADPDARGRWVGGTFELSLRLDAAQLRHFYLYEYSPAPVVSPWNGASGFFPKDRSAPLVALEGSTAPRLRPYGEAIAVAREVLRRRGLTEKPTKQEKPGLLRELRRTLPDAALEWLDAAIVLTGREPDFPPLLGSGGNDGHFEFSNNYAAAVCECLATDSEAATARSAELLTAALDGTPIKLERLSLAHLQRDSSPVNSPSGESDALGNPWDLILAVEGALLMRAGVARRHGWELDSRLVAPFAAHPVAAGYSSTADGERAYAELWMPLWGGWASLAEVELIAREARAQVGRRLARDGLDFVRASGELGLARGICAFERYPILERAGQARLAVPAGRIEVTERPAVKALRSLDPWLAQLRRFASGDQTQRGVRRAAAHLDQAMYQFAARGDTGSACAVLVALGDIEARLARSSRSAAKAGVRPVMGAPAKPWLEAADDGSGEFAVAAALASLSSGAGRLPDIRDYLHGTHLGDRGRRVFDSEFSHPVPRSGGPIERLAAIHARQHLDACREGARLGFARGLPVADSLASAFAIGRLDDRRILALACGLCLLDFRDARARLGPCTESPPCPALDALALTWHSDGADGLGPRPGWAAQLAAGRVARVLGMALMRLRLAGFAPIVSAAELAAGTPAGERLAAALLMRPSAAARARMARRLGATLPVEDNQEKETE